MTIGGNTAQLNADFLERLGRWNDACGGIYHVYIGVRTYEEQARLRAAYEEFLDGPEDGDPGRSILAAKPGPMARHMYGLAADVRPNPVPQKHMDMARQFGLRMDVPNEPWHIYHEDSRDLIASGRVQPVHDWKQPPAPQVESLPLIRRGSEGPFVRDLQHFAIKNFSTYAQAIIENGGADGIFGAATEEWVKEFQRRTRLAPDGIVGPDTWAMLKRFGL